MAYAMSCPGDGHPRVFRSSGYYLLLFVLLGFLCLFQGAGGLIISDGTFVLCGTSPELSAMHSTGSIRGGVDTLHQVIREPCEGRRRSERRYRTYDGTCNSGSERGAAFSYVKRFMPPHYQETSTRVDGPRIWSKISSGRLLPSARAVSRAVHKPKAKKTSFTLLLMQLGQLLDHDMSIVPVATEFDDTIKCCGVPPEEQYHDCFPIEIPSDDHHFDKCMEFVRSDPLTFLNGTVPQPRTHLNAITAYLDAAMVYGSDRMKAKKLRSNNGTGALLKTKMYKGKARLPEGHEEDCINLSHSHFCAMAGDDRVNEQPGLTAIHTVFHLEHNRLVRKLAKVILFRQGRPYSAKAIEDFLQTAPAVLQERMYQVVRKLLGGVWQNIVYNEYVPLLVGPELMSRYKLWAGRRATFDKEVDASIATEFLTAAFRFGHTLVNDMMLTDKMHKLKDLYSTSAHNLENYPNVIKGLVTPINHAEAFDPNVATSLVDHLFENNKAGRPGLDLIALNIQRGRDHGLPSFNELKEFFGLKKFTTWNQFGESGEALKQLYEHPDDVDAFTGGTCESSVHGGVVGELFAHILAQQFHDLKYGDRFFFETDSSFFGFNNWELRALKKLCMNKILCENAELEYIQTNPFKQPDYYRNPEYKCSDYEDINMWVFSKKVM
ncbi:chorion peroxidase-like [Littorina saxatilis]|uniref:Uncharacterized protein n=1 Tax=Littorina saxatilis TaxID=31220 RepID=A0AAN9GBR8_9CAEN